MGGSITTNWTWIYSAMAWITAFSLGLFGSLHCVGMCGPLMLAAAGRWKSVLLYQLGRILMYVLVGGLLGGLGLGAKLLHLQAPLAIGSGGLLLLVAFARITPDRWLALWPLYGSLHFSLRRCVRQWTGKSGGWAHFGLGCCNGLLPCGLVYLAVVGAANTGGVVSGAAFMLAFGVGTLPLLLVLLFTRQHMFRTSRGMLLRVTPFVVALAGVVLLWRGWHAAVPIDFQRFQDIVYPPMCQ